MSTSRSMKHRLVRGMTSKDKNDIKISLESFDLMIDQIELKGKTEINLHQYDIYGINGKKICEDFFYPYENVSVDQQLVIFRGRCPFRQYILSKLAKYGIKIWATCCTKTKYAWTLQLTFVDFICLYSL